MSDIKSIKEQYELKDICLKERLEMILPRVMFDNDVDMWICASKEYNKILCFMQSHLQIIQLQEEFRFLYL